MSERFKHASPVPSCGLSGGRKVGERRKVINGGLRELPERLHWLVWDGVAQSRGPRSSEEKQLG